jgi:hypothetical protein
LCFSVDRYITCVLSFVYKNYNLLLIGVIQRVAGDLMRVSVGTSCAIIHKVSAIFAALMRRFVKFPATPVARTRMTQAFYGIARFPGVAGCVDGTHVIVNNPGGPHAEVYRNRKGRFSINVQVNVTVLNVPVLV